jgi:hypothetical protein
MVPALLGLKGNLEMTLASRLSTAANMGHLDRWVPVIRYTLDERLAPPLVPRRLLMSRRKKSFSHSKKVLHGKNVTNEWPPFWCGLKSVDLVS